MTVYIIVAALSAIALAVVVSVRMRARSNRRRKYLDHVDQIIRTDPYLKDRQIRLPSDFTEGT